MKSVQGTIKILMESDFPSDLTPFLASIIGAQPNNQGLSTILGGGAQALPKRNKVTALRTNNYFMPITL